MKIGFMLIASVLAGAPLGAASADRQSAVAEPPYRLPERAVALKDTAWDVVRAAKTIAIVARDQQVLEVLSVDGKKVIVAVHGGIRREIDATKAKKDVERMLTEWERFTVVDDPAQADLVLFIFEDSVPSSRFATMQGDTKHRLRDRLGLFRSRSAAEGISEPLWADSHTESAFGALTGSSAAKVADKFRRAVEDAERKAKK